MGVAVRRSKTWIIHTFLLAIAGLLPALPVTAYNPEPLCSHPEDVRGDTAFTPDVPPDDFEPESVPMCAPRRSAEPVFDGSLDDDDATRALERARALAQSGRHGEAILALRVVQARFPRLADRLALEEGEYRMADGADAQACDAFRRAAESPQRDLAARADVARVGCLLAIGDRRAERELDELRRSYPELPQVDELDLLLAGAYELRGDRQGAAERYRALDLTSPGSTHAASARAALARLAGDGVTVRELTVAQQAERAERLTRGGYYELARPEIARLRAMDLPRSVAAQVARTAARMARVEGRWADAERLLREASGQPEADADEARALAEQASDLGRAAQDAEQLTQEVRRLLRGPMARQPTTRLFAALTTASRGGLREVVNDVLREIARRRTLPPGVRFDAAIIASGTGDDALVADLFQEVRSHSRYGVAARYHYARTLERLGRVPEARREYTQVIALDDRRLPYYALWARQRMRETSEVRAPARQLASRIPSTVSCDVGPYTAFSEEIAAKLGTLEDTRDTTCTAPAPATPTDELEEISELGPDVAPATGRPRPSIDLTPAQITELLAPIAAEHGEAFPWLARAVDLVRLGELRAATDELHEAYAAYREASGSSLNAGFVAVLRGSAPPRHRVSSGTWRDRRRLSSDSRAVLGRVSAALGDHGLAIRWDGFIAGPRPRAYEDIVEDAARRHGVEPELLFAVMRVESVYNPRIISYAGAIGLMQIMPRTGRLIAHSMGREEFTVDQLLVPEINIDFAAWYLASLIERWDGRLPLAIASYNGGPHNVRRWMRDHSETMPLDAFLERIPFDQTHRYVRRVLTHYEAYRAQRGQPIANLHVRLPAATPDPTAF